MRASILIGSLALAALATLNGPAQLDDRFVYNSSNGKTSDKEALIQSVLSMAMVGQTTRPA